MISKSIYRVQIPSIDKISKIKRNEYLNSIANASNLKITRTRIKQIESQRVWKFRWTHMKRKKQTRKKSVAKTITRQKRVCNNLLKAEEKRFEEQFKWRNLVREMKLDSKWSYEMWLGYALCCIRSIAYLMEWILFDGRRYFFLDSTESFTQCT